MQFLEQPRMFSCHALRGIVSWMNSGIVENSLGNSFPILVIVIVIHHAIKDTVHPVWVRTTRFFL